ncbi:MAG TPA: SPOR domain-containing protein [Candidatus Latescibacteria bacterium]|nr:SPOR domain-containing protein [Candidatus Latescibacterota bacterium]
MRRFVALVFLLTFSCGGPPQRDALHGREFDPLSLGDELTPGELSRLLEEAKRGERGAPTEPAPEDTTGGERLREVLGWQVQIFATTDYERASAVREEAKTLFGVPVYLRFEPPYYKVRVGECRTRAEAEALRKQAIRLGYTSAFPVRTRIEVPTEGP